MRCDYIKYSSQFCHVTSYMIFENTCSYILSSNAIYKVFKYFQINHEHRGCYFAVFQIQKCTISLRNCVMHVFGIQEREGGEGVL